MRSDYLNDNSSLSNKKLKVKKITESYTLTSADSGSLVLVNPTAAVDLTLPTITEEYIGWYVKIVLGEDAAGADTGMSHIVNIDMGSGTNLANIGMIQEVDGAAGDQAVANDDWIVNTADSNPGNTFDIWCDGYRWYVQGVVGDLTDSAFSTGKDSIA